MKYDEKKILELIEQGESTNLEFKSKYGNETEEAIAAFANTSGGIVLVGVKDNGKIYGCQNGTQSHRPGTTEPGAPAGSCS